MEYEAQAEFSMAVHDLLGSLTARGIALVLLPPPHSKEGVDIVERMKEGVDSFARSRGFDPVGAHMLANYVSDHLYEERVSGFEKVPVNKDLLERAPPDHSAEKRED